MASTSGASTGTAEPSVFIRICQWSVQFISICVPVLLAFTGAVGIKQSNVTNANAAASIIFIGIYMIVFAATLFIYELLKISPASMSTYTDSIFKKNFGFLYGAYGRGFYLIMSVNLSLIKQIFVIIQNESKHEYCCEYVGLEFSHLVSN